METSLFEKIIDNPIPFAHELGFTKLNEDLHKKWIRDMYFLSSNDTLQAHRGSYKTTCLIIAILLRIIGKPTENLIFLRKSQEDVKDVLNAVSRNIQKSFVMIIMKDMYGHFPKLIFDNNSELELDIYRGTMGRQVLGMGLNSSITGKHGSCITDDIITLKDRISAAHRLQTINQYQELINIASEDNMYIFNTGTPWHKDDAFKMMPPATKYDVYQTGIISDEEIQRRKNNMSPSLFSANYELKHIADGDILFPEPKYGGFPIGATAFAQIDAAYGGEDSTAFTIIAEVDNNLHLIGRLLPGHVDKWYKTIINMLEIYQVQICALENNADKGFLKKDLENRSDTLFFGYHEKMNKYYKITSFGKSQWNRVIIDIDKSDLEYISQIMDFNENAEHDDAPDSYASLIRWKYKTKEINYYT